jgi:hypothetical protein
MSLLLTDLGVRTFDVRGFRSSALRGFGVQGSGFGSGVFGLRVESF